MKKIGIAICGSFCTFDKILIAIDELVESGFNLTAIFSYNVAKLSTRFFNAQDFYQIVQSKVKKPIIDTIVGAEPVGTKLDLELLLVAPCTGNTLAKIANGITDTPTTMAVKAQLRNSRPVVLSVSSNDALGANAKNIGALINTKNIYFVPLGQDDAKNKQSSLIADTSLIVKTCQMALEGKQLQPIFL